MRRLGLAAVAVAAVVSTVALVWRPGGGAGEQDGRVPSVPSLEGRLGPRPVPPRGATVATPPLALRACRLSRLLRPACPSRVPAGTYPRSGISVSPVGRPGTRYDVFVLDGRPRRLVVLAGRYGLGEGPLRDGGPLEGHLVFRWRSRGVEYAVAVRAWTPRFEARAALRAVVASLPGPFPARQA